MRFRRKVVDVIATQFTETQTHEAVLSKLHVFAGDKLDIPVFRYYIATDFGDVEIRFGDWVVEISGKIKVLKDEYFKEHYEVIPEKVTRPKLIFTTDCA